MIMTFPLKGAQLYFHSAEIFCNQDILVNCSVDVFNDTFGVSYFTTEVSLLKKLLKIKIFYTINLKADNSKNFDSTIWTSNIDVCNLQKGVVGSFMAKLLTEQLSKYSNYKFVCPQPAESVYVEKFPINVVGDYLPRSLVGAFMKEKPLWEVSCIGKAKLGDSKPFVQFFKFMVQGGIHF